MELQDKVLKCKECEGEFVFTAGEQEFYAEKGFVNEPSRCKDCRQKRKMERMQRNREMHEVVCASCGKTTEVPFMPHLDKPVYCRECFGKKDLK
ncbi:MAG: zinc-ribbon domain containing protein [Bacillota bacterium]